MNFWDSLKGMKKSQKIILCTSILAVVTVMVVMIAIVVNNNLKEPEQVVSIVTKENAEKIDAFDKLQGTIIEDNEIKVQIEEAYKRYLTVDRYINSSIGPAPGILSELGFVSSEELDKYIEEAGIYDSKEYIKSMVKYEDFKNKMLTYMTEDYYNEFFSDYKDIDGYVGFCNCGGGVPFFEVRECKEIKLVDDSFICKMVLKDAEIYDHYLNGEDITYQECFVGQIVNFKNVSDNMVVDGVRLYDGVIEVEETFEQLEEAVVVQETEEVPEEQLEKEKVKPEEVKTGKATYYIKVNYGANTVTVYGKDGEGNYTVPVKAMICSCGRATPKSGVYKTKEGYKWGTLIGGVYGQYSTRIVGSILFHSVPYTAQSPDSLEYWEFDKLGTKASAGCVRLMVSDAKWIYNNCRGGTMVEFYSSDDPGPLGKPDAPKISDSERCRGWDPTDPAERKSLEK